ncbi:MAG: type II toxin-antitoxin system RelE/ParE family toxin [Acetobacteraceae bacterium]
MPRRAMTYRITQRARADIIDIYLWGRQEFGQHQAESYHEGLAAAFELIAANPGIARERPEFDPPVRLHPYQSHLIVYILDEAGILIIRVLHARQKWERLL